MLWLFSFMDRLVLMSQAVMNNSVTYDSIGNKKSHDSRGKILWRKVNGLRLQIYKLIWKLCARYFKSDNNSSV